MSIGGSKFTCKLSNFDIIVFFSTEEILTKNTVGFFKCGRLMQHIGSVFLYTEKKLKENIRNTKKKLKRTVHQLNVVKSPKGFVFVAVARGKGSAQRISQD